MALGLDRTKIIAILQKYVQVDAIKFVSNAEDVVIEDVGDGNLNYLYKVYKKENPSMGIIVKTAPAFIKCLGPDYELSENRSRIEYEGLVKYQQVCPGYSPKPYFYDPETHTVGMEFLSGHELMRKQLLRRELDVANVRKIARFMGCLHRDTHVATLGQAKLEELDTLFKNDEMVSLTNQYVFTRPFVRDDPTNRCSEEVKKNLSFVYDDQRVLEGVVKMKALFLNKKECLLHGDLHTGSIMIHGTTPKIIDTEFSYVGPCAFDIGMLIANYIFSYYHHMSIPENNDARRQFAQSIIQACHTTVNVYLENMTAHVGEKKEYVDNLLSEVAGFAGCEIIRRIIGAAHVEDLEGVKYAEEDCLQAGVRLLNAYQRINNIDQLLCIALMLLI